MEVVIREATSADFDQVSSVFLDELDFHSQLLPDRFQSVEQTMELDWFLAIVEAEDRAIFMAELGTEVVGVLHVEMRSTPNLPFFVPRHFAYISDLAVIRGYRFRGIGRSLMKCVVHWAEEHGADAIELNVWEKNSDAISFYERLGFTSVQRRMNVDLDPDQ